MTEAQAWREIARRYAEGEEGQCALCDAINDADFIGPSLTSLMYNRLDDYARTSSDIPRDNCCHTFDDDAVIAALWLALEAA